MPTIVPSTLERLPSLHKTLNFPEEKPCPDGRSHVAVWASVSAHPVTGTAEKLPRLADAAYVEATSVTVSSKVLLRSVVTMGRYWSPIRRRKALPGFATNVARSAPKNSVTFSATGS